MSPKYTQGSENELRIKNLKEDVKSLRKRVEKLDDEYQDEFVTKTEYEPVRKIVYGIVSLVLVAFATAVIALVIK